VLFEKNVLKRVFGLEGEEVKDAGGNNTVRSFHQILFG
jgi:hypothetical protein